MGLGINGKLGANRSRGGIRTHRKQLGWNDFLSPLLQIHESSSPSSHAQLSLSDFTTTVTILNILTGRRPDWQARTKRCEQQNYSEKNTYKQAFPSKGCREKRLRERKREVSRGTGDRAGVI